MSNSCGNSVSVCEYNAIKTMDEKATVVKNLSWQDGYVSSIDGVTIAAAEEHRTESPEQKGEHNPEEKKEVEEDKHQEKEDNQKLDQPQQQQQHKQKEQQNQQSQEQQLLEPTMESHRISLPSKQPTVSILKTTTSTTCEVDGIYANSSIPQRYQSVDTKSYNTDKPWSSSYDKENSSTSAITDSRDKTSYHTSTVGFNTSVDANTNAKRLSLFEEEYQRKLQLMRSNAKRKEEKLFVLLNRNAGVITHVIRSNPKYLRK